MIRLILAIGLIVLNLSGCDGGKSQSADVVEKPDYSRWMNPPESIGGGVKAITMPHHLLVKSFMDKFFTEIAAQNSYDRVVIISPNHFGYGFNLIQTTDVINTVEKKLDKLSLEMVKSAPDLDKVWIKDLADSQIAWIEPKFYSLEHGVFTEYPFIKEYWPKAKVVPIIIKRNTPQDKLDDLVKDLEKLDKESGDQTLFLFSMDFTHYTGEEFAVQNDLKMLKWLGQTGVNEMSYASAEEVGVSADKWSKDSVAVDSPESLYVAAKLMKDDGAIWNFWARTSSASMIKNLSAAQNTSHIFSYWTKTKVVAN